jgi:hypothetical protein
MALERTLCSLNIHAQMHALIDLIDIAASIPLAKITRKIDKVVLSVNCLLYLFFLDAICKRLHANIVV